MVWLGLAWGISAGVRWDGAVFCGPLWLWALWAASWRQRLASVGLAAAVVIAWAVPMVQLTGGWDVYRQALASYLQVWSAQSAYVVGDFSSGGETQATYNLNFLVNYLRQMLGIGLLLVLYLFGRRFGPARLATDQRSRFLLLWTVPPLLVYVFAHLGESGYVLSLAPQAAILVALAAFDLGDDVARAVQVFHARGAALAARGARTGRGDDQCGGAWRSLAGTCRPLRAVSARAACLTCARTTRRPRRKSSSCASSRRARRFVLAHDILRQLAYYQPVRRSTCCTASTCPIFRQPARVPSYRRAPSKWSCWTVRSR